MTTLRHRTTVAALTILAATLSACANDPTSPLNADDSQRISASTDSVPRRDPTLPWYSVQKADTVQKAGDPTLPWYKKAGDPTLPWY
jgi:hypothetical protein